MRGAIALIRSKSGRIVGTCELIDVVGPLSLKGFRANARKVGFRPHEITGLPYQTTYAWVLRRAKRYRRPRPYVHPNGAVIWVRL